MTDAIVEDAAAVLLARLNDTVTDLLGLDLTRPWEESLVNAWAELETIRCRLAAVESVLISEIDQRGIAASWGFKNTAALGRSKLRISGPDSHARIQAAKALTARRNAQGETMPVKFAQVAAAQRAGQVSPAHAAVITKVVDRLPSEYRDDAQARAQVETALLDCAGTADPNELARCARTVCDRLDPDGTLADVKHRDRTRELTIHDRPDGSSRISGEATAELTAWLHTVLDPLTKPLPDTDGVKDPRTATQRRHDALLDALKAAQRATELPSSAGITTTVLLTAQQDEWAAGTGMARTGNGHLIPMQEAKRWATGDARAMTITFDPAGGIVGWTDARRLFTENQRLAIIARDGGCSFPGCESPPAYCEINHVDEHTDGGLTTVDNGTLVCRGHHRHALELGWKIHMTDGRPAWIAPPWLDPDQIPRKNHVHQH